jgi:succinyl-CoA synthetase beta subunit
VPTGGRGKAGGIRMADTPAEAARELDALLGGTLKGHTIRGCRIETRIAGGREVYLSLSIDAGSGSVRVLVSAEGGVDIEAVAPEAIHQGLAAPDETSVQALAADLAGQLTEDIRAPVGEALSRAAHALFATEALLLEINPLFVRSNGTWLAGDAKIILDDNAFPRQPGLVSMAHARAAAYPETEFKLVEDFDYIELDPAGTVGMVTTGAGLSMMLVDQLADSGISAFNFCDMRTGQMKGSPHRLKLVLERMRDAPGIRAMLVNVFAGITDLGEFSRLLVQALNETPGLADIPIVARLIGNGLAEAEATLAQSGARVILEPDLDRALAIVTRLVRGDAQ